MCLCVCVLKSKFTVAANGVLMVLKGLLLSGSKVAGSKSWFGHHAGDEVSVIHFRTLVQRGRGGPRMQSSMLCCWPALQWVLECTVAPEERISSLVCLSDLKADYLLHSLSSSQVVVGHSLKLCMCIINGKNTGYDLFVCFCFCFVFSFLNF